MIVGRKRRRLDNEGVGASDVFLDFDEDFHVGETPDHGLGQRLVQALGDFLRQHRIGIAGDQLDRAVLGRHRRFPPSFGGYNVEHTGTHKTGVFRRPR